MDAFGPFDNYDILHNAAAMTEGLEDLYSLCLVNKIFYHAVSTQLYKRMLEVSAWGVPWLHVAAARGWYELASRLIGAGADISFVDPFQKGTALHWAAAHASSEVGKLLLEHGADTDIKDVKTRTALHIAAERGAHQVASLLLERGADITATDDDGETALHFAVKGEHEAIVQLLLDSGLDVNNPCLSGETPLYYAVRSFNKSVVLLLIKHGANIEASVDLLGWTALHEAATFRGSLEILELFVDNGANIKSRSGGYTPLHSAAQKNHVATIQSLLARGAEVDARDNLNLTPLHWAAMHGHRNAVLLLLAHGPDPEMDVGNPTMGVIRILQMACPEDEHHDQPAARLTEWLSITVDETQAAFHKLRRAVSPSIFYRLKTVVLQKRQKI